jgi:thiol:disulfide interchange protein DsbC
MKARYSGVIAATLAMALCAPAVAQDGADLVEKRIREIAPNAQFIAVSETPVEGLLQVQINGDIVYASADGNYLIQGRVIDLDTREDLTENAKASVRREKIETVDDSDSIIFGPEDPVHELLVFTDIDCGYCRKLHSQIEQYADQGISIHYMSFPRAGVGSASFAKAVSVWCADDRQDALTRAKAGEDPEPLQCDNTVAQQYRLGQELGVTGTPALITADGNLIPGYVPPDKLRERLDSMAR